MKQRDLTKKISACAFGALLAVVVVPSTIARADQTDQDFTNFLQTHGVNLGSTALDVKAAQVLRDRRQEVFDDPATPVGGNPKGDVTIVEFFDYRCPYCKQVHPTLQKLLDQDRKLRFVYKEFPVLGEQSDIAAHAALAARLQGRYEAFHNAMMAAKGQISEELVYRVAGSVGLDVDRLKRDMTDPEIERALSANRALAKALELRGTPGFIIGDHIVPGAIDLDALKTMVADARKQ